MINAINIIPCKTASCPTMGDYAIKKKMTVKWVEWETTTKSLYEDMCRELFDNGEVAASMFISCYVRDADDELAEARRKHIDL